MAHNHKRPSWVAFNGGNTRGRYWSRIVWSWSKSGNELFISIVWLLALTPSDMPIRCHHRYHGKGHRFVLASERDPALVNKGADFLKDHYLVPPHWKQDRNKGLVRNHEGRWMQPERPKLDDHPDDLHHHLSCLGLRCWQSTAELRLATWKMNSEQ